MKSGSRPGPRRWRRAAPVRRSAHAGSGARTPPPASARHPRATGTRARQSPPGRERSGLRRTLDEIKGPGLIVGRQTPVGREVGDRMVRFVVRDERAVYVIHHNVLVREVILSGFRVVMTSGLIPIRRERNGPAAAAGPEARTTKTLRPEKIITATTAHAISCCRQTRSKR